MSRGNSCPTLPSTQRPPAVARILILFVAGLVSSVTSLRGGPQVDYLREIKPILRERCYSCHGALKQKNGLRLDTASAILKGGKEGPVVQARDPDRSVLIRRVTSTAPDERMPPEHEGEALTAAQVKLLREWIAGGAPSPADEKAEADPRDHWAFRSIARPKVPKRVGTKWARNPIDAFVAQQHARHGLVAVDEAPREVLLRRLYLDLIGLPPSAQEIDAANGAPADTWYEATLERLLADPRHGERWARHWMDVWRYSDWWGLGDQLRNSQKHIWHWRDWIVDSLNADLPYDEMIRLMLAADELHPNDLDKLRATGFLARNWFLFNRNQWMEETVEHVGKGLLGLTFNCAKCHDHKYDPIPQADFYRLRAFFEPYHVRVDVLPGVPDLERDGIPRAFDGPADVPTYRFVRGQESQPDKSVVIAPGVPAFLDFQQLIIEPVSLPREAWQPERRPWVLKDPLEPVQKQVDEAEAKAVRTRRELAAALRREADALESSNAPPQSIPTTPAPSPLSRENAERAVADARGVLAVAESTLAWARAELAATERRIDATRSVGTRGGSTNDLPMTSEAREQAVAAIKAERAAGAAKARLAVAEAEQRLAKAPGDRREATAKELKLAQQSLTKAMQAADAPVKSNDTFTILAGAKWTPTRFLSSGADDPLVPFLPHSSGRRKALAEWIADRRNPLTARVAVNHLWAHHLGAPLVPTVFDFGRKGAVPAQTELLDWLAAEFIESGWSMKRLHRLIVLSSTYRLSSSAGGERAAANARLDPDNIQSWRRLPIRLEGEVVRDSILALAGTLEEKRGGPPVPPNEQDGSRRRSLYFFHSNNDRNRFLLTFDAATVKECYRRDQSIVPQQALALGNSRLVHDAAGPIAKRLSADDSPGGKTNTIADQDFVRRAFAVMLGIKASPAEVAAGCQALKDWRAAERESPGAKSTPTNSARAHLVWALVNHNDFVTLR